MQPENPAQLGGKIYEMMGMALSGKWSTPVEAYNNPGASSNNTETIEAEVVEPVEAGSKK
jgi:heat shock protein beta